MDAQIDLSILEDAVSVVKQTWPDAKPACGLILGSGWESARRRAAAMDAAALEARSHQRAAAVTRLARQRQD